jgi:F-type H+-transporting ATPase subunit b
MEHEETLGQEALEHAETGMPQLDFSLYPNLIFWLVVALIVLYLILSRVAIPRIGSVISERHDAIANDIEQAQLLKRRAEEAEAAYNKALAEARDEAHRISAETRAEIQDELKALTAKADAEIAAKAAESEKRIAEIRESAAQGVEEVARATAVEIVEALAPGVADKGAVDQAIANRLRS